MTHRSITLLGAVGLLGLGIIGCAGAGGGAATAPPPGPDRWTYVGQARLGDGTGWDVATAGITVVVVGVADEVGSGPMAWTTTDGTVWERQAVFDPATGPGLRSVAQIGDLLVAVGPGDSSTAVWTSTDGRAWTRAYYVSVDNSTVVTKDFEGAMAAVAARPSQFVAVGLTVGGLTSDFGGAAWTSADGHAWSPAPASVSLRRAPLLDVTVGGPGFDAVGGIDGAVAMTSSDGVSWLLHDLVDRLGNLQLRAVAAGSNGRLVTVGSVAGAGAVATSDDGVSWSLVPCQPVLQGASLETVVAIPDGFVAAGSRNLGERSVMSIWTSSDGVTWSIVDIPDPAAGQPLGIGLTPLGLVAAGNGGVWVGPSNGAGSHELRTGGHCSDAPDGTEGGAGEEPVPGDPAEEPGVEPAIPPDEPAEP